MTTTSIPRVNNYNPNLTIITINRNNVVGLEKTMQSVLNQTCPDFGYVVVDGARTDRNEQIIRY